jgi:hypothetical protein
MTKVAVAQILSTHDVKHNLASAKVVRDAVAEGAKVSWTLITSSQQAVFLPRQQTSSPAAPGRRSSSPRPSRSTSTPKDLQALPKELGVVISAGVHDLPEADENDDEPEEA